MRRGKMPAVVVLSVLGFLALSVNVEAQERRIPNTLRHRDRAATSQQAFSRFIAEGRPLREIKPRWEAYLQNWVKGKKEPPTEAQIQALIRQVTQNARRQSARSVQVRRQRLAQLQVAQSSGKKELAKVRRLQRDSKVDLTKAPLQRKEYIVRKRPGRTTYSLGGGEASAGGREVRDVKSADVKIQNAGVITKREDLPGYARDLESQLNAMGDDAQLLQLELQKALQRQQQMIQTMSNIIKVMHDTAKAVLQNIRA